ncbi:unnamed protein product [Prunus armeniaca]|uniref:Uncharacterized protein n=1 Tax=Prunus armeniaca TaxID=36596 RepID=A0A6J5XIY5_PRUAR|nr:unnamed protein product [Prunus armeniaca]
MESEAMTSFIGVAGVSGEGVVHRSEEIKEEKGKEKRRRRADDESGFEIHVSPCPKQTFAS